MNTNYLLNNLSFLQSVALKYIHVNELGSQFDKNDLVNHGFLKFHEVDFNSESHFLGSFCKYMKLTCMGYRRQERRKIDVDFCRFRAVEVDTVVVYNDVDNSQLLRECIALETNINHQKILLYLGSGHCYDFIADKLELSRTNIRNHAFDAKKKLIDRLAKRGLNVSNNKKVHRYIDVQFKTDNSPLYDDFPFLDKSFYNSILFVMAKENKPLSRHDLVSIIARNRGRTFDDCRNCVKTAISKLINEGRAIFDNNVYSLINN